MTSRLTKNRISPVGSIHHAGASVSVVIPVWRNAHLAAAAVASVFAQTAPASEVILVDDHSGDDTLSQLECLRKLYPLGWLVVLQMPHNGGPGEARNLGVQHARGKYVAFLDADDVWHPKKLEAQIGWMEAHEGAAATCTSVGLIGSPSFAQGASDFQKVPFWQQLFVRNSIATSSVLAKKSVGLEFAAGKRHAEDFLLWSELMAKGLEFWRSETVFVYRRKAGFGDSGLTGDLEAMRRGALDAFDRLSVAGYISRRHATVAKGLVWVRHFLRLVKLSLRKKSK